MVDGGLFMPQQTMGQQLHFAGTEATLPLKQILLASTTPRKSFWCCVAGSNQPVKELVQFSLEKLCHQ